jgi:nucleoside-diphosphate-sugar epimerase
MEGEKMMLVTGGAGFIGSHLVEALLREGRRVRILDNLSTGKIETLIAVSGQMLDPRLAEEGPRIIPLGKGLEFHFGDITDLDVCRRACTDVESILHQAALGSVQRSVEDPIQTHGANATGTLHILQAARERGVKRVVYASSSSVYGNLSADPEEVKPKAEDLPPAPQSPYAATKLLGEIYCRLFSSLYGLETVSLRYFNVFGPRQSPESVYAAVIPKFMAALSKNAPPMIYGDGGQSRDFTYVENVVQANLRALGAQGISGEIFNIACGQRTSVNDLYSSLQKVAGSSVLPTYGKGRSGEVRHSLADIGRAQARFGYEAKISLGEGLERTWRWFLEKGRGGNLR